MPAIDYLDGTSLRLADVPEWLAGADHQATLRAADLELQRWNVSARAGNEAVEAQLAGREFDAAALAAWNAAEQAACRVLGDDDQFARLELTIG